MSGIWCNLGFERSGLDDKNKGVKAAATPEPKIAAYAAASGKRRAGGRQPIADEFMDLNVSRQRKWQLRQRKKGLCALCSAKAVHSVLCLKHALLSQDKNRKRRGPKRRYNSKLHRVAVAAGLVR
jgi:hypothetical protein